MYRDRKKWEKGKCLFSEIKDGEWAVCIIHNPRHLKNHYMHLNFLANTTTEIPIFSRLQAQVSLLVPVIWAVCIIHNIHSGMIHTISSPYNEDLLKDGWICFRRDGGIVQ